MFSVALEAGTPERQMVTLIKHDLEFILKQIAIAEAHTALIAGLTPEDFAEGDPIGEALRSLVDSPLLPSGLRTVDGSYNNLVPGREQWGASGEPFKLLTQPNWVNENDDTLMFGTPANPVWLNNGNYTPGAPGTPGFAPERWWMPILVSSQTSLWIKPLQTRPLLLRLCALPATPKRT